MNVTGNKKYFITNSKYCLRRKPGYSAGTTPNIWDRPNKNFAGFQVEGSHHTDSAFWGLSDTEACAGYGASAACIAPGTRSVENKEFLFSLDFFVLFYQEKRTRTDYRNTNYADNGNIEERTDIGIYHYSGQNAGPHTVTSLSNTTGTLLPTTSQAVDYTAFNKAFHIAQGNKDYFITYGPDRLRTKTSLQSGIGDDVLLTKYYAFGDYEKETDANGTHHLHYISGGDGLAAIYVKNDNAADSLYFILKDHLGSIVGAINEETGKVYRQSFDAWGRKRNPENWTYSNIPDFIFARGYTGHEHLKWFGFINMNGRMYDVATCRFLSPDPYVQMPDNTQNLNRYSYALNNPLIYTDPDGEFIIPALMIGAFVNVVMQGWTGNAQTPGDFALAAGIGALAGAAGAGVGAGVGSLLMGGNFIAGATGACMVDGLGFFGGAVMGGVGAGVSGFFSGSGNSWAGGSNFSDGLNDGLKAAGTSAMYGAAFGGVITGFNAISDLRNFWSGSPQSSGRTLFSFKNGSPIYNTLSYQGGEYRSLERYYFQSDFSQHSSHAKLWDGYSSDRPGTFMKYHNSIAENGNSLNLPSSRIIDLSKFRGASEMTINANLDPGTWVTYNVDGQNVITLKDYPAIYNKVKLNIPAGSNTLTITLHGKSAFSGINRTTINSFIRGWIKAYKLYDNFD